MNFPASVTKVKSFLRRQVQENALIPFYWIFKILGLAGFDWRRQDYKVLSFDAILTILNFVFSIYLHIDFVESPVSLPYSTVLSIGMNVLEYFPIIFTVTYFVLNSIKGKQFYKLLQTFRRADLKVKHGKVFLTLNNILFFSLKS